MSKGEMNNAPSFESPAGSAQCRTQLLFVCLIAALGQKGRQYMVENTGKASANATIAAPTTQSLMRLGDHINTKGDKATAVAFYRQAAATATGDPEMLLRIGDILSSLNAKDDALAAYRAVMDNAAADAELYRSVGRSMLRAGHAEESAAVLRKANALDRQHVGTYLNLGIALDLAGRPEEAAASYRQGLKLEPAHLDLKSNLALSLALTGQESQAVELMADVAASPEAREQHFRNVIIVYTLGNRSLDPLQIERRLDPAEIDKLRRQATWIRTIEPPSSRARALGAVPAS
jgi:Flp pilus assembly protein TadD